MNKSSRIWVAVLLVSLMGFAGYSLAFANSRSVAEQKASPSIVGVVTDISGANLTIIARDNNTYQVDAGSATVITGFIGPWSKPSSLSDIQVTDTLTVIGDVNGSLINAERIAHNKTPQTALANNPKFASELASKSSPASVPQTIPADTVTSTPTEGTSTGIIGAVKETVGTVVDKILDFITGTTTSATSSDQTSHAATSTPDAASSSTESTSSAETVNASSSSDNI